jgi:FAD/FMN-containing dehydrogenase
MPRKPSEATLADLRAAVGDGGWAETPTDVAPYLDDFRRLYHGATPLVLMPADTAAVARIMTICARDAVAVVPHGGNTGYCGGATPDETGTQVVLALRRMHRIRSVDAANYSIVVDAGCTLAAVQEAAKRADRLFPLSLGSEGSAQIGGNLSTNAGGTAVLRYGMMRDLVLGLEVVLADGRVMPSLKGLRKDNTGYDLKNLFIGAEGTLGVITAACLKLFAPPAGQATAIVGVATPDHALMLLVHLRAAAGDQVTAFELMPRRAVEMTVQSIAGVANPLALDAAWYVLVEVSAPHAGDDPAALLEAQLGAAAGSAMILDALVANSGSQSAAMWKLRESVPEAQRRQGASLKHDVSVPISAIPRLIAAGSDLIARLAPEGEVVAYGHVGDGNLHFNVSQRGTFDRDAFLARKAPLEEAMFDLVESLGGSFSAEHGIGRLRAAQFVRRTDPVELSLMRDLKRALDPQGLLNPGKVLP